MSQISRYGIKHYPSEGVWKCMREKPFLPFPQSIGLCGGEYVSLDHWLEPEIEVPGGGRGRGAAVLRNSANSKNAGRRIPRVRAAQGGNPDRRHWHDLRRDRRADHHSEV